MVTRPPLEAVPNPPKNTFKGQEPQSVVLTRPQSTSFVAQLGENTAGSINCLPTDPSGSDTLALGYNRMEGRAVGERVPDARCLVPDAWYYADGGQPSEPEHRARR